MWLYFSINDMIGTQLGVDKAKDMAHEIIRGLLTPVKQKTMNSEE